MKIVADNTATIERIGVGQDQSFKINFDAKMARILADGLYSDKVQSVIRELSCNAYDSHVMAGYADRPIEVHFPNRFEPWFHVRDTGTGLSHDDVMNIYTTYGASTKTNSNEFIGQLGLGSKSPFALAEAFTVTARKDGIENHYSCYRNEQGMPSVAHLHSQPTTEPNGVCVTVPVSKDLRDEFMEKAREVYKWFPVKPEVVGETVTYPEMAFVYQGAGWSIRKPPERRGYYGSYRSSERPVAIMGLVAYPLDFNSVKGLSAGAKTLLTTPMVLNFNIGDLEVAANREALGYDERTCANIVAKMDLVVAELGARFEQEIANAKTLWEAKRMFGEIFSKGDYAYEFAQAYKHLGLTWQGQVIKDHGHSVDLGKLYPKTKNGTIEIVEADVYETNFRWKRPRKVSNLRNNTMQVECDKNTVIMFNDLKLGGVSRVMEYNKAHENKKSVYIFNASSVATWDKIKTALGNPEVIYTSTLARPARKQAVRTGVLMYNGHYNGGKKAWTAVEIDLDQGGFYVDLEGWDIKHGERFTSDLSWWKRAAAEAGLTTTDAAIYAMRNKHKKLVREHAGWKNFFDVVKTKLTEKLSTRNLAQELVNAEEYRKLNEHTNLKFWEVHNAEDKIKDTDSPALAFVQTARAYNIQRTTLETLRSIASRFDMKIELKAPAHDLVAMYTEIVKQYPMLRLTSRSNYYRYDKFDDLDWKTVFDYINYVDSTRVFYALQERDEQE